jgi:hypothetical protein
VISNQCVSIQFLAWHLAQQYGQLRALGKEMLGCADFFATIGLCVLFLSRCS